MDVLSESLRRATQAAPPTRIDVDALIAGERRRRHVLIGGSVMGTAAASVAVLLLAQVLISPGTSGPAPGPLVGGPTGCVAPTPTTSTPPAQPTGGKASPDPSAAPAAEDHGPYAGPTAGLEPVPYQGTEPVDAAKSRLSNAFADALRAALPGVPFRDWADPNCPLPQFITYDPAFPYESAAVITDAHGRGDIVVHLYRAPAQRPSCELCSWQQDMPGGGLAFGYPDDPTRVDIWRPDGTGDMILAVDHRGDPARPTPPATREQMIAIGGYPTLSLHP
jgi:hypothetical protein